MSSLRWALIQYDRCPYKKRLGRRHTQREDHVEAQGEDSHPHAKERGVRGSQPCQHLDARNPASRTVKK
ncbi:unnamed protein product [Nyctereutes procyonoides]|uniref:(raccoon dog) hypothetical protein n=1 Tax=Nyctereutes procyonoides TaxID=34880 RepID=A0A811ZUH8_NYCPR|nr:unnamed protein product [Nyctereutes procyonoides]